MNGEIESGDFGKTAKKLNFAENLIKIGRRSLGKKFV